jgi:methylmalonyl-CoA mutase cobalamin-binding domain/chain
MSEVVGRLYDELKAAILAQNAEKAEEVARDIIRKGGNPLDSIEMIIKPTAEEIGKKFESEEFFLPQLMLAGIALEKAMDVFLGEIAVDQRGLKPGVLIGTVKGDIHTIGKNIVAMMLRTGGFQVHDLGVDIDVNTFIEEAVKRDVKIIALSSLLTTTLPYQKEVIEELIARGLRGRFKVIVGGGPATQKWADDIGADGYGKDAVEGLAIAKSVLNRSN